jgi:hypothetical protein
MIGDGVAGVESGPMLGPGGEDLVTLEAEITELQRENARVESQMMRLRTDITAMEQHLRHGDKVSSPTFKLPSRKHAYSRCRHP